MGEDRLMKRGLVVTHIYIPGIYVPLMGILLDKVNSIIKREMLFYVYCPLKGLKHDLSLNLLKNFFSLEWKICFVKILTSNIEL